jgi:hypothetical protein
VEKLAAEHEERFTVAEDEGAVREIVQRCYMA